MKIALVDNSMRYLVATVLALFIASPCLAQGKTQITKPVISDTTCPVQVIEAPTPDGQKATAIYRRPPGKGPFPALIYLHGGLEPFSVAKLKLRSFETTPTLVRFLAAGYITVAATFRDRSQDPLSPLALADCKTIIEHVRKMPEVDPNSIVVWGDSGGGSLALELAGELPLAAVVAQEPATVLMTGMYNKANLKGTAPYTSAAGRHIMQDPKKYYTPEIQKITKDKIAKINCPVLIAQGDKALINKVNNDIVIPEIKAAGKKLEVILYPNQPHGFSHGGGSPEAALKFYNDSNAFMQTYLKTKPTPLDAKLIKEAPAK